MELRQRMLFCPDGELYHGEPIMEINTAKWALNLHLLEMATKRSSHLLGKKMQLTCKPAQ